MSFDTRMQDNQFQVVKKIYTQVTASKSTAIQLACRSVVPYLGMRACRQINRNSLIVLRLTTRFFLSVGHFRRVSWRESQNFTL